MAARRRLRLGMVGGGQGAFIGGVHRIAARLDDHYEFVAGALASDPARAKASARRSASLRIGTIPIIATMARAEAAREDRIDVVSIVTPNDSHHPIARAFLDAGIPVICDKPLTTTLADARTWCTTVRRTGLVFAVTHNYTGHPMVRQAREMIAAGELGEIRVVQVEYAQDWLATRLEDTGQKQADWRTDPARSRRRRLRRRYRHARATISPVSSPGLTLRELAADLSIFVPGRRLDDNAHMLLRFEGGARGMLWSSQVAPATTTR